MKKNIDILLEKYFGAETSLEEEKILKEYFRSGKVDDKHEKYRALFCTFDREKEQTARLPTGKKNVRSVRIVSLLASIAAMFTLAVVLFNYPKQAQSFAIIQGERITDEQYIENYVSIKFEKVNNTLSDNFSTSHKFEKVKTIMNSKINSLERINRKIQDILYENP